MFNACSYTHLLIIPHFYIRFCLSQNNQNSYHMHVLKRECKNSFTIDSTHLRRKLILGICLRNMKISVLIELTLAPEIFRNLIRLEPCLQGNWVRVAVGTGFEK